MRNIKVSTDLLRGACTIREFTTKCRQYARAKGLIMREKDYVAEGDEVELVL
jgi:hypothetical protein